MQEKLMLLFCVYLFFFGMGFVFIVKDAKRAFLFTTAFLTLLFLLSLLFLEIDSLLAKLPFWLQWNMTLVLWLALGGILGLLSVNYIYLKRITLTVLLNTLFLLSFWYYNEPVYTLIKPTNTASKVTNQTTLYSCACASLSTIAKHKGLHVSERDACKIIGTTRYGSNPGQIRYAVKKLGFHYKTLFGETDINEVHPPAILFMDRRGGYENHAVAYLKKTKNGFLLYDPMEGWMLLERKQIRKIWHGRGIELRNI